MLHSGAPSGNRFGDPAMHLRDYIDAKWSFLAECQTYSYNARIWPSTYSGSARRRTVAYASSASNDGCAVTIAIGTAVALKPSRRS